MIIQDICKLQQVQMKINTIDLFKVYSEINNPFL